MRQRTLRRALGAALACAGIAAVAPAAASASTWTVDDDRLQCPNASFSSLQAAVDQAAPWDTLVVCDGVYEEQSRPASGAESPSAAGSVNGLTITKSLTIRGAGAGKVTIRPASSLTSLAGTTPYLRDGGGNVITVSKQARGATDGNELFVAISGVTVDSPATYAEAGIAFFNASGSVVNSVVGPLPRAADAAELAARPHGWGIVMTNHLQGASEGGIRREVTVAGTRVAGYQSGGILFDDARGADGAPETLQRSGIVAYGTVIGSAIVGSGPDALIPQTGVQYHAGQRGSVSGSVVSGNLFTPDARRSAGVLLTDAQTGPDPANPGVRGFFLSGNAFTGNGYGLFNADAANAAVRAGAPAAAWAGVTGTESFWGCTTGPVVGGPSADDPATPREAAICQGVSGADAGGAASVDLGSVTRTAAGTPPVTPGVTVDAAPTASIADPTADTVVAGRPLSPVVGAKDDFGVRAVELALDGAPLAAKATAPYEFDGAWTPGFDQLGSTVTLSATVVDSAGQTAVASKQVTVVAPPGYTPITVAPTALNAGDVLVGSSATRTAEVTNSGQNPLTLGSVDVAGGGFSAMGCAAGLVLAPGESCTITVTFAPGAAGAVSGSLTIAYSAIGGGAPVVVSLAGRGTTPAPVQRVPVSYRDPYVSGTMRVGETVRCQVGGWTGDPTRFAYAWGRDGDLIRNATGATYRLTWADAGRWIGCRVTASNSAGTGRPAYSDERRVQSWRSAGRSVATRVGPAVATVARQASASGRRATLTLGDVACIEGGCAVKATATLTIGGKRYAVAAGSRWTKARGTTALRVTLGRSARRALAASRRGGSLRLKVAARTAGATGSATSVVKITR